MFDFSQKNVKLSKVYFFQKYKAKITEARPQVIDKVEFWFIFDLFSTRDYIFWLLWNE